MSENSTAYSSLVFRPFCFFFRRFPQRCNLPIDWWKSLESWSVICSASCWCFFLCFLFCFVFLFFSFCFLRYRVTVFECFRDEDRMCMSEILKTDLPLIVYFCLHRPARIDSYVEIVFKEKGKHSICDNTVRVWNKNLFQHWLICFHCKQ